MSPRSQLWFVTIVTALSCGCATDAIPAPRGATLRSPGAPATAQSPGLAAGSAPIANVGGQAAPPPLPTPPPASTPPPVAPAAGAGQASAPPACVPKCTGRVCGPDACGGTCGQCAGGMTCDGLAGRCIIPKREASCGNGTLDPDEECDGGEDCTDECRMKKAEPTPTERCENLGVSEASEDCIACVCSRCPDVVLGCYASGDKARDERCTVLSECGYRNDCHDQSCYCGTSPWCRVPNGACRAETEAAADLANGGTLARCDADPECATYRARSLGECVLTQCSPACRLTTP